MHVLETLNMDNFSTVFGIAWSHGPLIIDVIAVVYPYLNVKENILSKIIKTI